MVEQDIRDIFRRHLDVCPDGLAFKVRSLVTSDKPKLTNADLRLYQTIAMEGRPLSAQSLRRLCSCWKACYEIHSIAQNGKTTLLRYLSIPLATKEIETQMRQSLFFEPGTDSTTFKWKVHFPTAIASDGTIFSVLRTIHRPYDLGSKGSYSCNALMLPFKAGKVLVSAWAPYEENGDRQTSERAKVAPFDSWQGNYRKLYLYWVTFSNDGKYIFYNDQSLGTPKNIAVFGISEKKELDVALKIEARLTQYDGPGTESLESLSPTFHPSYPAVAFAILNAVYLCTFVDGQSSFSIY